MFLFFAYWIYFWLLPVTKWIWNLRFKYIFSDLWNIFSLYPKILHAFYMRKSMLVLFLFLLDNLFCASGSLFISYTGLFYYFINSKWILASEEVFWHIQVIDKRRKVSLLLFSLSLFCYCCFLQCVEIVLKLCLKKLVLWICYELMTDWGSDYCKNDFLKSRN